MRSAARRPGRRALQWVPVEGLTFRGQYQRAIRGPSVAELFLGQTVSFDGAVDPCQDPAAAAPGALRDTLHRDGRARRGGRHELRHGWHVVPGDPGRQPRPVRGNGGHVHDRLRDAAEFAPNLIATVDYYNIKIDDVITTGVGTQNLVDGCYDFGVTNLCNQIVRTSDGRVRELLGHEHQRRDARNGRRGPRRRLQLRPGLRPAGRRRQPAAVPVVRDVRAQERLHADRRPANRERVRGRVRSQLRSSGSRVAALAAHDVVERPDGPVADVASPRWSRGRRPDLRVRHRGVLVDGLPGPRRSAGSSTSSSA